MMPPTEAAPGRRHRGRRLRSELRRFSSEASSSASSPRAEWNEDLQRLRSELESLVSSGSPGIIENMLPGKALLEQLGRHDLQKTIEEQGGHFQVAALLGYRPCKWPSGYWDMGSIDAEVTGFLESLWGAQEGGLEVHALTGETRDPRLGDADQPPYLADGLLPNGEALLKYGRSDLVGAIRRNGGFKTTARNLGRRFFKQGAASKLRAEVSHMKKTSGYLREEGGLMRELGELLESSESLRGGRPILSDWEGPEGLERDLVSWVVVEVSTGECVGEVMISG